jgi:peptide/nickel transport system permease protein
VITYVARRLLLAVVVLAATSFGSFVFFTTRFGPPPPIGPWAHSVPQAASMYWHWLVDVAHGNLAGQIGSDTVAATWRALAHTAALLAITAVIVVCLSVFVGTLAAARARTRLDLGLRSFAYIAWAIPAFLLGLILQSVFRWVGDRYGFHPFSLGGWPGQCQTGSGLISGCDPSVRAGVGYVVSLLQHLTLPAVALALAFVGIHARYLRSGLLVALNAPYTTTARAKGLPEYRIVLRHALRNSLATFAAALLLDFGAVFGAAMAVDYVFQLGGLGTLYLTEIATNGLNPYAVVLLLTITAAMVLGASLSSELVVAWLDPRTRLE